MRLFRAFRFLLVMVGYSLHMMWAGRALKARAYNSFVATRQRIAARKLIQGLRITTEVKGSVPEDLATLISPNHIGALDPWIIASHFDVAFVAKAEMGTWPVIKTVTKAVAIIFAHRKNVMKTAETLNEIQERMRSGVSVLVFPEGTTSDGTDLLPFKTTGFQAIVGMEDGFVIPVYFHVRKINGEMVDINSRKTVTWHSGQDMFENIWDLLDLGPLHYLIRIGSPIPAAGKNRKELAFETREAVRELMQQELREIVRPATNGRGSTINADTETSIRSASIEGALDSSLDYSKRNESHTVGTQ